MKKVLKNNMYMMKIVFKYSPWLILCTFAAAAFFAMTQFFTQFIFMKKILQYIERSEPFNELLIVISVGLLISLLLRGGHEIMENYFIPVHSEKLKKGFELHLYEKVSTFDLSCYDDTKFFNDYIWTMHNATKLILNGVKAIGASLHQLFLLIGIVMVILSADYIMALIITASVILSIIINMYKSKVKLNYKRALVPSEKKKKYIERLFYLKDSAKDIRLTSIKKKFNAFFNSAYTEQSAINKKMTPKIAVLSFIPVFMFRYFISTFAVYTYFAYRFIVENNILISEFVIVTRGLVNLYNILNRLSGHVNALYNNSIFIDSMRTFLDYEPSIKTITDPEIIPHEVFIIEFINVNFKYPNQKDYSLKNINLIIKQNCSLAIVGYNGAGKTTLIKLLLRLYDVHEGEILLNGINIKKYDLIEYRRLFATVFQDFQIFAASIGENVLMDTVNANDENILCKALFSADFQNRLHKVDKGIDAQMTREFDDDGILLSGGEEQKIAIARVFAQEGKLAIMDEPSAALDPIAEYILNKNIYEDSKNRALILISHRLTTTLMADKIIMLIDGEIVEEGTHDELMKLGNHYAGIFNLQAKKYLIASNISR